MTFDESYNAWLDRQRSDRTGEALRRLNEGHAHNEKLFLAEAWYPAIGSFEHLHAEYEVRGYKHGYYYLDFALLRPPHRVAWEIDDFSSHAKNVTRRSHEYHCERQNQLVLDGWTVFRIPLDAIRERPKQVQQFVLQAMGKLYGTGMLEQADLNPKQREIVRFGQRGRRPFTPGEIARLLGVSDRNARDWLQAMMQDGLLEAVGGQKRIRSYRLTPRAERLYFA